MQTKPGRILVSKTSHFLRNQAFEEQLYSAQEAGRSPAQHTLMLWRNSPVVVIGRHQNPRKECHLPAMERDNVLLARRESGGGAVYQDLGNTNFTFVSPLSEYSAAFNTGIVTRALASMGVAAEASGRNDILAQGRKVSGSAYRKGRLGAMHHGTMLLEADLDALQKYLNPDAAKLRSKGIESVRSRVVNVRELAPEATHARLVEAMASAFREARGLSEAESPVEEVDSETMENLPGYAALLERLASWKWTHGETPEFDLVLERRFGWGNLEIHLNAKGSIITDAIIFSDSLYPSFIELLQKELVGRRYLRSDLMDGLEELLAKQTPDSPYIDMLKDVKRWIPQVL